MDAAGNPGIEDGCPGDPMIRPLLLSSLLAIAPGPDAAIEAAARRTFAFRVHLREDAVEVRARSGVVTLTGTVENAFHRSLAEETVLGLAGVRSVRNRLVLRADAPPSAGDAWLEAKVRAALRYRRNLEAGTIQVDVKDGAATLSGDVASDAERDLAASTAQDVEGIQTVRNGLTVRRDGPRSLAEHIDDATLTAQVKAMLLTHKGTRMLATRVRTVRGVVTLRGRARSAKERALAGRVASEVRGVRRVVNRMSLAGPQGHP